MLKLCSYTFLTVLTVDLLATCGDMTVTWTSPVLPKLHSSDSTVNPLGYPISLDEESWIGSLINIGALIGPIVFGALSDRLGRKISLLCSVIPCVLSLLILAFARNIYLYYFARLLAGITVGSGCGLLPIYIAEIADDESRGMLSVSLNIFWTFGNLVPYLLGPFLTILWFNIILLCLPITFVVLFSIIGPESPYFLLSKGREEEAEQSLIKLRSKDKEGVQSELNKMKSSLSNEESGKFKDLFKSKANLKALSISLLLIGFQQLSGINVVLFYTELIFMESGSEIPAYISSIIIGLVLFASSLVTPLFANRLGRKFFLMISSLGTMVAMAIFGAYFHLKETVQADVSEISWLPVVSLVVFIVSFNFGLASIPWTVGSELFPVGLKSLGSALVAFSCWLVSFLVTRFFNDLNLTLGKGGTFWIFSGCCCCNFLFTWFFVPETRGKSFKEIQEILQDSSGIRK